MGTRLAVLIRWGAKYDGRGLEVSIWISCLRRLSVGTCLRSQSAWLSIIHTLFLTLVLNTLVRHLSS